MKKYYPVDFDTKGNAILGEARNTPTSNSFIPTKWTPGGGSEDEGNGIMSISISPSITTTPALESFFPIYYEDLTDEQKQSGVTLTPATDAALEVGAEYTFTITPTADMYIITDEPGAKGEPVAVTEQVKEIGGIKGIRLADVYATSTLEEPTVDDMVFVIELLIRSTDTPQ